MIICPDKDTSIVPLQQPFHIIRLFPVCSASYRYFCLSPCYDDHTVMINISLDTANINTINISTPDFRIWQHFNRNWTTSDLQKLTNIDEVTVAPLYKYMTNTSEAVHSFTFNKENDKDPSLIWVILTHPGTYIGTIGMSFAVCILLHCFKRFWFRPATPRYQPYFPVSSQNAIVEDDVEAAPIYTTGGPVDGP